MTHFKFKEIVLQFEVYKIEKNNQYYLFQQKLLCPNQTVFSRHNLI